MLVAGLSDHCLPHLLYGISQVMLAYAGCWAIVWQCVSVRHVGWYFLADINDTHTHLSLSPALVSAWYYRPCLHMLVNGPHV